MLYQSFFLLIAIYIALKTHLNQLSLMIKRLVFITVKIRLIKLLICTCLYNKELLQKRITETTLISANTLVWKLSISMIQRTLFHIKERYISQMLTLQNSNRMLTKNMENCKKKLILNENIPSSLFTRLFKNDLLSRDMREMIFNLT
jgi:hypothetical protein